MEIRYNSIVRSLWGYSHADWCCLDSRGTSHGVLLMWNRRMVEKIKECVGRVGWGGWISM